MAAQPGFAGDREFANGEGSWVADPQQIKISGVTVAMRQRASLPSVEVDRPPGDGGDVRLCLRDRADRRIVYALRIAALRLTRVSHGEIRTLLGLTVDEYRHARRWLARAVGRSIASAEPFSVEDALNEHGDRTIVTAVRIGAFRVDGYPRAEIQRLLRLTDEQYNESLTWLRDAITATHGDE